MKQLNFTHSITYKLLNLLVSCITLWLLSSCSSKDELEPVASEAKINYKIEGIDGPLYSNVLNYLNSSPAIDASKVRLFRRDIIDGATKALKAMGYYQPKIELKVPKLSDSTHTLVVNVDKGKALFIKNFDVAILGEGANLRSFANIIKNSNLGPYKILNHGLYEDLKNKLQIRALALGFFDAKFIRSNIYVYEGQNIADIVLYFDTGIRYKFGKIVADDKSSELLYPSLGLVNIKDGDNYSTTKLNRFINSLSNTNYYTVVDVSADPKKADNYHIPVDVNLERKPNNLMRLGAGFSTDEGLRLIFDWQKPLLNKYGHSLSLISNVSMVQQNAQLMYKIPRRDPNLDYYYLKLSQEHNDLNDTLSDISNFSVHYVANNTGSWRRDYYISANYEDYKQGIEDGYSFDIMPGFSLSRIETSRGFDPKSGISFNLDVKGASKLFSDHSFLRIETSLKSILSPTANTRLITRFTQGAILGPDALNVPPSLRFFVGGDNSIRGYGYLDESERFSDNSLKGARYKSSASLEYQFPIGIDNSRLALFMDAGIATDDYSKANDILLGPGFGYRFISRYGVLKVDLGFGIDKDPTKIRLHFAFGPEL